MHSKYKVELLDLVNKNLENEMDTKSGFSLQVQLVRQIQSNNGQEACYATPATVGCTKKQNECSWRHDCFQDAEELDGAGTRWMRQHVEKAGFRCWIDGAGYRYGSRNSCCGGFD